MGIYIFVFVCIFLLRMTINPEESIHKRKLFMLISSVLIITVSILRKYTVGRDLTAYYRNTYLLISDMPWSEALKHTTYEIGYVAFYKLVGFFTDGEQWMIAVHSIIVLGVTCWFIYRNSEDCFMSIFLFIAANTWFTDLSIMRQTLSVAMELIAVEVMKHNELGKKRIFLHLLLSGLAVSFHTSGLIVLLIPILNHVRFTKKNTMLSVVALISAFVFYDAVFSLASRVFSFAREYDEKYGDSNAAFNFVSSYEIVIPAICFFIACWTLVYQKRKHYTRSYADVDKKFICLNNDFLLYGVLCLVLCRAFRIRLNIMGRMAQYFVPFMWILFPRAINSFKLVQNRKIVRAGLYIVMSLGFLWMGYNRAQQFYGTVPYTFFWEQ